MSQRIKLNQAVLKATDATLTTDNWQRIMEVCDLVKMDPEDNSKIVIQCLEKRFEQKDANVILRTISLTIALAENCGSRLQQEISSKHFTNILYSLIENQQVHIVLKRALANCVEQLAGSFKSDPSLKSMADIHRKILKHHGELLNKSNKHYSALHTFEKNQTDGVEIDPNEDDKELAEAIRLSLQEYELAKKKNEFVSNNIDKGDTATTTTTTTTTNNNSNNINIPNDLNVQIREEYIHKKSQLRRVKAMYDLNSKEPDELSFRKGDVIVVLEQVYRDWWRGSLHGKIGIFPINYVTPLEEGDTVENTINNKEQTEAKILNSKDKIDQLHLKLQNSNGDVSILSDNSINTLYGEVTPMRPEITKLIGKYAGEREKLASLYQLLANAEATYNDIIKRTTSMYATSTYNQPQTLLQSQLQYNPMTQQQQYTNTNIPSQQYPNFPPQQPPPSYR